MAAILFQTMVSKTLVLKRFKCLKVVFVCKIKCLQLLYEVNNDFPSSSLVGEGFAVAVVAQQFVKQIIFGVYLSGR